MKKTEVGNQGFSGKKAWRRLEVVVKEVRKVNELRRVSALLPSVNIGPKAATTFLLPSDGSEISDENLICDFKNLFSGTPMENCVRSTPLQYCHDNFWANGFVRERYSTDFSDREKTSWALTNDGRTYLVPAACLALKYEAKHRMSLYSLLGATNTTSEAQNRAPFVRSVVLLYLSHNKGKFKESVLGDVLGIDPAVIRKTVVALGRSGMIKVEKPSDQKRSPVYTREGISKFGARYWGTDQTLILDVASICQQLYMEGVKITQSNVYDRIPFDLRERTKEESLRIRINHVLFGLSKQGYLKRESPVQNVSIDKKGEDFVRDFLVPLFQVVRDKNYYREVVEEVRRDLPYYAKRSAELYYLQSKGYRRKNRAKMVSEVYDLLQTDGKGLSIGDLQRLTEFNEKTLYAYLVKDLQDDVERELRGGEYYYSVRKSETRNKPSEG